VCALLFCSSPAVYAQPAASTTIIADAASLDGTSVEYEGEVIGDSMRRGEYTWLNVHDGKAAIGCWVPEALASAVRYTGSYKARGDWIRVTGVLRRACPEHGGDLDIHVQSLRVLMQGRAEVETIDSAKKKLVLLLWGGLCLVLIVRLFRRKPSAS
jgi:hypothetical protein